MANLNDDDVAANRIHHADGSFSQGPVTAPATVWTALLNQFSSAQVATMPSDQSALLLALKGLCAPV
jgi:hypothetical protein